MKHFKSKKHHTYDIFLGRNFNTCQWKERNRDFSNELLEKNHSNVSHVEEKVEIAILKL